MKTKLLALMCLVMAGCTASSKNMAVASNKAEFEVIVIDGCQYLYYAHGNNFSVTHKGNCNNPIHQNSVQYQELILKQKGV